LATPKLDGRSSFPLPQIAIDCGSISHFQTSASSKTWILIGGWLPFLNGDLYIAFVRNQKMEK